MARRIVALVTSLLMAHLTFVGGDVACANHSADAAGMLHHATAHHVHGASNVDHAQNDQTPCRTPSVPMCCQALQSCTLAVAVAESTVGHLVASADDSTSSGESAIPPSEIIAPDPPPPRA